MTSPCPPSLPSIINIVLASLEESACFRHLELQVSSLLERVPLCKVKEPCLKKNDMLTTFVWVNDAYPKSKLEYKKSRTGKKTLEYTPFLLSQRQTERPWWGLTEEDAWKVTREQMKAYEARTMKYSTRPLVTGRKYTVD